MIFNVERIILFHQYRDVEIFSMSRCHMFFHVLGVQNSDTNCELKILLKCQRTALKEPHFTQKLIVIFIGQIRIIGVRTHADVNLWKSWHLTYDLYFILEYCALEHDHIYMFFIFIQSFINLSLSMHILAKTRNIYVSISPIYCHLLIFLTSLWIFRLWQVPSLSRPRYRPIHFRQHIH